MITLERQSLLSKDISAAESRPRWLHVLQGVAKEFGYAHVSLMRLPRPEEDLLSSTLVETTLPIRFIREFDQMRLMRHCPLLPKFEHSLMPQRWSLKELDAEQTGMDSIVTVLKQFGIHNGLLIPTNSLNGDRHVMRFDGHCDHPSQVILNELGMIALHAFDVYERMRRAEMVTPRALTKRELEVIRWTSQGKTSAEIGQILSLSDHTINAYLNNAIRKLDCVNRTQLVAKSIRLKLIS
ncbi:LuxR C-terminal-related transcriptional regulator [Agrobacterium sp. BA1120]|uniref:helix-turn-helix transcriptional regulator n=1 Tax=Agrobacterium sp. BA1120 TaxID=3228927 RepID=UPI000DDF9610